MHGQFLILCMENAYIDICRHVLCCNLGCFVTALGCRSCSGESSSLLPFKHYGELTGTRHPGTLKYNPVRFTCLFLRHNVSVYKQYTVNDNQ